MILVLIVWFWFLSSELLQPSVLFKSLTKLASMSISLDLIKVCFWCCFGDVYDLVSWLDLEQSNEHWLTILIVLYIEK